jgi:hypothetical protein
MYEDVSGRLPGGFLAIDSFEVPTSELLQSIFDLFPCVSSVMPHFQPVEVKVRL